jgi:hypothetical protein
MTEKLARMGANINEHKILLRKPQEASWKTSEDMEEYMNRPSRKGESGWGFHQFVSG